MGGGGTTYFFVFFVLFVFFVFSKFHFYLNKKKTKKTKNYFSLILQKIYLNDVGSHRQASYLRLQDKIGTQ